MIVPKESRQLSSGWPLTAQWNKERPPWRGNFQRLNRLRWKLWPIEKTIGPKKKNRRKLQETSASSCSSVSTVFRPGNHSSPNTSNTLAEGRPADQSSAVTDRLTWAQTARRQKKKKKPDESQPRRGARSQGPTPLLFHGAWACFRAPVIGLLSC